MPQRMKEEESYSREIREKKGILSFVNVVSLTTFIERNYSIYECFVLLLFLLLRQK